MDDALEMGFGVVDLPEGKGELFDFADAGEGRAGVLAAGEEQDWAGGDEGDDGFGVEVGEEVWDVVIDAVLVEGLGGDEVLATGQAAGGHAGAEAFVEGHEPPGAGGAHADAQDAEAGRVDLGVGGEEIEGDEVIAEDHAPEGTAKPEVELGGGELLRAAGFGWAAGTVSAPFAEAVGVDAEDRVSPARECGAGRFGGVGVLEYLLFSHVVFVAVPVAVEEARGWLAGWFVRQQEIAVDG